MKTLEMEVALMRGFNIRANIIVPNVSWGLSVGGYILHECDLLVLSKSWYATEIEIKVSKQDLLKDKEKWHQHQHPHIRRLFFAVPKELQHTALKEIPEDAGLIVVDRIIKNRYRIDTVKNAKARKGAKQWQEHEVQQLTRLGTMRIIRLKQKILKLSKI